MLTEINPKLPMRDKTVTRDFYLTKLGFEEFGSADFEGYLMVKKDKVQIHFFEFRELDPTENYGQVYIRTDDTKGLYKSLLEKKVSIHPNRDLQTKPWGQKRVFFARPRQQFAYFRTKYFLNHL
jgi:hypothetical protein